MNAIQLSKQALFSEESLLKSQAQHSLQKLGENSDFCEENFYKLSQKSSKSWDPSEAKIPLKKVQGHLSSEEWSAEELKALFDFCEAYGTKWSQIQSHFPGRSQNNLKNKYYGFIKMTIRHLLKELGNISGQKIRHISANELNEIYEGTRKHRKLRGLLKQCMREIDYQISRNSIRKFIDGNQERVRELHTTILEIDQGRLRLKEEREERPKGRVQKIGEVAQLNNSSEIQNRLQNFGQGQGHNQIYESNNGNGNFMNVNMNGPNYWELMEYMNQQREEYMKNAMLMNVMACCMTWNN